MARSTYAEVTALSIYAALKQLASSILSGFLADGSTAFLVDVNIKQTGGQSAPLGAGNVGATVPRVTIAADDPQVTDTHTISLAVFAEDAAHTTADKGIQLLTVQKAVPVDTAGTDGDYQPLTSKTGRLHVSNRPIGVPAFGVSSARFTSADASGAAVAVTDAPVSTQKLVIDGLLVSSATDVRLDFTCETSGVLIASIWLLAKTSFHWIPANVIKLATADKKLFVQASAAAVIYVTATYHSEA